MYSVYGKMTPKLLLMQPQAKKLKHDVQKYSNIVKNKYMLLRRGKFALEHAVQETLNPLISPLNQLVQTKEAKQNKVKHDAKTSTTDGVLQRDSPVDYSLQALDIPTTQPVTPPLSPTGAIKKSELSDNDDEMDEEVLSYVALVHQRSRRGVDCTYGVRLVDNKYKIGNQPIYFKANKVVQIGDAGNKVSYKGTIGLYELLFKTHPTYYTEDDLVKYKNILYQTSAHRLNYTPTNPINVNKSHKYKTIISQLFNGEHKGHGFYTWKQVHPINHKLDYKYWDDPNELVDRLYLLIASRNAGHTGHENEIKEIIQELRDATYIQ